MKDLTNIEYLKDVRVLLRADFNVPIVASKVENDYRIRMALPTINALRSKGAKVIIISHIEVKDGEKNTLEPVAKALNDLGVPVKFVKNIRDAVAVTEKAKAGECILLENLRQFDGEKANDPKFAQELASLADVYVNDAFSVSHREHASVVGVPKYIPAFSGLQMQKEIEALTKAFHPDHPFLFILGGAKFETKLPLLERFIRIAENVFVVGALAHDFFEDKGYELGKSLTSDTDFDLRNYADNPKLLLPIDVVVESGDIKSPNMLTSKEKIVDAGPKTLELLSKKINEARFILWNGPLGLYEGGYKKGTLEVAKMIASRAGAINSVTSIVGGGDTLAAIAELGIEDKFTFVSTAGGAMLEYLSKGTLPGIDAISDSKKQ